MKRKILSRLVFITAIALYGSYGFAQDYSAAAKQYFSEYMSTGAMEELTLKSFPTLEECKFVFHDKDAEIYYQSIQAQLAQTPPMGRSPEKFVDLRIDVFSTQDILAGKGNYAGGMEAVADKMKPYVLFYKVNMLREMNAQFGMAYKYFVCIKGNWVMFPKPWEVFAK